jgi:hypothetical protein
MQTICWDTSQSSSADTTFLTHLPKQNISRNVVRSALAQIICEDISHSPAKAEHLQDHNIIMIFSQIICMDIYHSAVLADHLQGHQSSSADDLL